MNPQYLLTNRKQDPLLSIIIPNYNYGRFLADCFHSIEISDLSPALIEVIIVDDASRDDSISKIKWLMKKSPLSIRLIRNAQNIGLVKTRNKGIRAAKGEYLFFLDADNMISRSCLSSHLAAMEADPTVSAAYAPIQDVEDGTLQVRGIRSNQAYDYGRLLRGNYIDAMAMFRKKDLIELGNYDEQLPRGGWEDFELWLRVGRQGKNVRFIEGPPLSFYRLHSQSMVAKRVNEEYQQIIDYLAERYPLDRKSIAQNLLHADAMRADMMFLQLFFQTDDGQQNHAYSKAELEEKSSAFTEYDSIILPYQPGDTSVSFRFAKAIPVTLLRFDPLNKPLQIQIHSVELLLQGKKADSLAFLKSNHSHHQEINILTFENEDPSIILYPASGGPVWMDEVIVSYKILEVKKTKPQNLEKTLPFRKDYGLRLPFPFSLQQQQQPGRIAVVCHIYYPELIPEIEKAIAHIPFDFDLLITTDTDSKAVGITEIFQHRKSGKTLVRVAENRGRDIAPKLLAWQENYTDYDYVLHIHTKQTAYLSNLNGWRQYQFENLIGSADMVRSIFQIFETDARIGMIAPKHFHKLGPVLGWGANVKQADRMAKMAGLQIDPEEPVDFPSGSMFWARTQALIPLLKSGLKSADFEEEIGQTDNTLAHGIERLYFKVCEAAGYKWIKIIDRTCYPEAVYSLEVKNRKELSIALKLLCELSDSRC